MAQLCRKQELNFSSCASVRRCVKKLRSSIKTHEEPDVVAMLSKITAKLPKAQNEIWRSARPNDSEHPMSIKRTGTSTARCAAFYDMRSALSDVSSGENNGTGGKITGYFRKRPRS